MKLLSLGTLIAPFKSDNIRLWQSLDRVDSNFKTVVKESNSNAILDNQFEIRFELSGAQSTGSDVYPVWKQVTFPLNSDNTPFFQYAKISYWQLNAKVTPGSDYQLSLLASKDRGVSFLSLMQSPMTLPAGLQRIDGGSDSFANPNLGFDWFLRLDQVADGVISGVELVLQGAYL